MCDYDDYTEVYSFNYMLTTDRHVPSASQLAELSSSSASPVVFPLENNEKGYKVEYRIIPLRD